MHESESERPAEAPKADPEGWCYRNLIVGMGLMAVGLVLTLTVVLVWLGTPLLILGALVIAIDIAQSMRVMRQRGIDVVCPYCRRSYRFLPDGRHHLMCDDCQKEIPI